MGNREDLLAAARGCIADRGIADTSARDLARAAGTSLAAIGYHFGGKDALLAEALLDVIGEGLGEQLSSALRTHDLRQHGPDALVKVVGDVLAGFAPQRAALAASLENLVRAQHLPDVAARVAAGQREAIAELSTAYAGGGANASDNAGDADDPDAVGALLYALINGLVVMWFADPDAVPTAERIGAAVRTLAH